MPKNNTIKKRQKRQMKTKGSAITKGGEITKGGADDQENSRRENCMKDVPKLFLAFFRQTIDPNSRQIPEAKGCEKNFLGIKPSVEINMENLQFIANNIEEIAANQ